MLWLLWGCSTTNHAVLPKQAYHDITSHYNAYFNANEKLKGVIKTGEAAHKDDFDSVLAVYAHNDYTEFSAYNGDLEDAIKRSTNSIQLHNIANWSDDNMLLIGKCYYLKGDYDKAAQSFKYITTEYKTGVDYVRVQKALGKKVGKYVKSKYKKKKAEFQTVTNPDGTKTIQKSDNRPEKSIWWHTPARTEALIWLIKTYTRQKKYNEAASVITMERADDNFYKDYDPDLELAHADLEVSRKNYSAAIEPLEKYLAFKKIKKKKRLKSRPLFVLAQCYEVTGNYKKAVDNYTLALKSRPTYDMEFYAKIKMAKLSRKGSKDNADIRKLLSRMAKDGKYKDYWDQVYYELALLSLEESNRAEARRFLRKSIDYSTTNDDQKALSFLKLAEMDYEEELYVTAKYNYDSTLLFMAKNDPRYADIEQLDKVLDNLVEQLKIIAEEDSLQKLASLPEEVRNKIVKDAIFKKEMAEEERKAQQSGGSNTLPPSLTQNVNQPGQNPQAQATSGSTWYFYNTSLRTNGYNDFIKKWGRRKYEENWRRKNKTALITDEPETTAITDTAANDKKQIKEEKKLEGTPEEQMLANVPTTPEKLEQSNARLAEAYYTAGTIYKDGLDAYKKAQAMFEEMNKRLGKHKLLLESYYNLYLIAQKLNLSTEAESYKQRIIAEFPESIIAKVLKDPYYVNETKRRELEVNNYYESAYNDYNSNRLDSAWYKCKMSDAVFKPNPLSAKFDLLLAMVLSKQNKLTEYVQALQKLSNKCPDVEVKKTASDLLNLLNKSSLPQVDLSLDTAKRDSLNAAYIPSMEQKDVLQQLAEAKEQAKKQGADVKVDNTPKQASEIQPSVPVKDTLATVVVGMSGTGKDTAKAVVASAPAEDTTSVYTRTENTVHYFIVYLGGADITPAAITSIVAKLNAFNSTQFESKRLQTKQVKVDSKTTIITVRQFPNGADAMAYFNTIKSQAQLYSDFQPGQYTLSCISTANFATLLSEKNIEDYQKFFKRVYK